MPTPSPSDPLPDGHVLCVDGLVRPLEDCAQLSGGGWADRDETVMTYDGSRILASESVELTCGDFAHEDDDNVVRCADECYRFLEDCTLVDDEWYRTSQTFTCDECGDDFHRNDAYYSCNNALYCESCYVDNTDDCSECGRRCHNGDLSEDGYCSRCTPQEEDPCAVLGYSNRSANKLRPSHNGPELLGVELEVEPADGCNRSIAVQAVRRHLPVDYCVFKEDGSLGMGGFEIVTRPDTMEVHREMFRKFLDSPERRRVRSWDSGRCGMHVHVNRKWLSQLQLGKMLVFVNHPRNQGFVSMIAGRTSNTWARYKEKKISDVKRYDERYVALNIGPNTAEFRIFRGNVMTAGFVKNLEFVRALVEFTAPSGRSIAEATSHKAFVSWVCPKTYPALYDFLAHKGLRPARKKKGGDGNEAQGVA